MVVFAEVLDQADFFFGESSVDFASLPCGQEVCYVFYRHCFEFFDGVSSVSEYFFGHCYRLRPCWFGLMLPTRRPGGAFFGAGLAFDLRRLLLLPNGCDTAFILVGLTRG